MTASNVISVLIVVVAAALSYAVAPLVRDVVRTLVCGGRY